MADLSDFKRDQIVGARMVGTITKSFQMFGISRGAVSKVMIVESRSCQRETIELYIELLERNIELRHLKLLLSLMNTSEPIIPKNYPSRVAQKIS